MQRYNKKIRIKPKRQKNVGICNLSHRHSSDAICPPINKKPPNSMLGGYADESCFRLTVNLLHVGDELEHLVRVTDLVVIPANNLNEGRSQLDTGLSVEDRSAGITEEVA